MTELNSRRSSDLKTIPETKISGQYKRIVIIQAALLILGLTLSDFLSLFGTGKFRTFVYLFFLMIGPVYMFSLCRLLKNLTRRKWLHLTVSLLLLFVYLMVVLLENPLKQLFTQQRSTVLFFAHIIFLLIEILIIFTVISDIFSFQESSRKKLWGAASLLMMIAISFASLYDLIIIVRPDALGRYIRPGFSSYAESVYYSLRSLLKLESVYPDAIHLVQNIGVIESVTGELFLALLIGSLFSGRSDEGQKVHVPEERLSL